MTRSIARTWALVLCWTAACGSSSPAPTAPAASTTAAAPAIAGTPPEPAAAMPAPAATPPAPPPSAPAPAPTLGETPADKVGTVPPGLGLAVGAKAPDATLLDVSGKPQRLAQLFKQGPTFVVFYRGGWCPFCNLQLHGLTAAKPDFDKRGIRFIAISVDTPGQEAKTEAKNGVPFPMLSDSKLLAHKAFNVVHLPDEAEPSRLAGFGIDLEQYSGETHHSFAVPSIFLIDRTGTIRWRHIDQDFRTRPTPAQLLHVVDVTLKR